MNKRQALKVMLDGFTVRYESPSGFIRCYHYEHGKFRCVEDHAYVNFVQDFSERAEFTKCSKPLTESFVTVIKDVKYEGSVFMSCESEIVMAKFDGKKVKVTIEELL